MEESKESQSNPFPIEIENNQIQLENAASANNEFQLKPQAPRVTVPGLFFTYVFDFIDLWTSH